MTRGWLPVNGAESFDALFVNTSGCLGLLPSTNEGMVHADLDAMLTDTSLNHTCVSHRVNRGEIG